MFPASGSWEIDEADVGIMESVLVTVTIMRATALKINKIANFTSILKTVRRIVHRTDISGRVVYSPYMRICV